MTKKEIDFIIKFFNKALEVSKNGKQFKISASYHLPSEDDSLCGWLLYADWYNKMGKHKYTAVILED